MIILFFLKNAVYYVENKNSKENTSKKGHYTQNKFCQDSLSQHLE